MSRHVCPWLVGRLLAHLMPGIGVRWDFTGGPVADGNVMPMPTVSVGHRARIKVRHNGVWTEHEAVVRGTYGRVKSMTVDVG